MAPILGRHCKAELCLIPAQSVRSSQLGLLAFFIPICLIDGVVLPSPQQSVSGGRHVSRDRPTRHRSAALDMSFVRQDACVSGPRRDHRGGPNNHFSVSLLRTDVDDHRCRKSMGTPQRGFAVNKLREEAL
jgi:hypothetical protein